MTRKLLPSGRCARCHRTRPVWTNDLRPLDLGTGVILEADTRTPDLCDDCDLLTRLTDPGYRALCWPAAAQMEAEALANGGVKPHAPQE
jgi:hypothetical protein